MCFILTESRVDEGHQHYKQKKNRYEAVSLIQHNATYTLKDVQSLSYISHTARSRDCESRFTDVSLLT